MHQVQIAKELCKIGYNGNIEGFLSLISADYVSLLFVYMHNDKLQIRGRINKTILLRDNKWTIYFRSGELLIASEFADMKHKTSGLVQVNAYYGTTEFCEDTRWVLSTNIKHMPFVLRSNYSIATNGLIIDTKHWRM